MRDFGQCWGLCNCKRVTDWSGQLTGSQRRTAPSNRQISQTTGTSPEPAAKAGDIYCFVAQSVSVFVMERVGMLGISLRILWEPWLAFSTASSCTCYLVLWSFFFLFYFLHFYFWKKKNNSCLNNFFWLVSFCVNDLCVL